MTLRIFYQIILLMEDFKENNLIFKKECFGKKNKNIYRRA